MEREQSECGMVLARPFLSVQGFQPFVIINIVGFNSGERHASNFGAIKPLLPVESDQNPRRKHNKHSHLR